MIWRVMFLVSVVPIAVALLARWWFGIRVLSAEGRRICRCDAARWAKLPGAGKEPPPIEAPAREHAVRIRAAALAAWSERAPKLAASREGSKRFGMAVPPLTVMVAVFAILLAKVPVMGGISIILAAIAISATLRLLGLGSELRAVAAQVNAMRESRVFPRLDDEDAVAACAAAEAWNDSVPPVLKFLQP
jgi:hypothetical protein